MSQICIARTEEDAGTLLADAEIFMNALRRKPEASLHEALDQAPGIQVLDTEGEVCQVRTSMQRAIDVLSSPTNITFRAGHATPRMITLLPENGMIDHVVNAALKSEPTTPGPGAIRPSADKNM